jgi:spore maturation protein CgeB
MRLLAIGNPEALHVGAHFMTAAEECGIEARLCDVRAALSGNVWLNRASWHVAGHRAPYLGRFTASAVADCLRFRPDLVLATGLAPVTAAGLRRMRDSGPVICNFLTDDPFNPVHRSRWFAAALREYDLVFTPRRSNLDDLRRHTGKAVRYLPFAYAPAVHYREPGDGDSPDVFFAGGADADRVPVMEALIRSGLRVQLYGGYWGRYGATRGADRGYAGAGLVRRLASRAKVCLCLVRRANRDGHCMRTFELAAMGGCILAEDTAEHREIFGGDGRRAALFGTTDEMIEKAAWLTAHEPERRKMSESCRSFIVGGNNSYADRLRTIVAEARR